MIKLILLVLAVLIQFAPLDTRPNDADPDSLQPPPRSQIADPEGV